MRKKEREINELTTIESIISQADVCRIAMANDNIPYIVTMNFGYSGNPVNKLYFHCANEGRKIEMIRKNNYVCFEMDTDHKIEKGPRACDFSMHYRSVVGYGFISVVEDPAGKITGLNMIMSHYSSEKEFSYKPEVLKRTTVLCLEITEITGKKSKN
jgi:hypothetical protein